MSTAITLNKKLFLAGCISVLGLLSGGYAAHLPNRVPGTSGLIPSGVLEWLAVVVLSAGGYCAALLSQHLRTLGVSRAALVVGLFAASIPCAAIAAVVLTVVFYYAKPISQPGGLRAAHFSRRFSHTLGLWK